MVSWKTFLINLDRSPERLAVALVQAEAICLTFDRMAAVDGYSVPLGLKHSFFDPADGNSTPLTPARSAATPATCRSGSTSSISSCPTRWCWRMTPSC